MAKSLPSWSNGSVCLDAKAEALTVNVALFPAVTELGEISHVGTGERPLTEHRQFKHDATILKNWATSHPTVNRHQVEVSCVVPDQRGHRVSAVGSILKGIEYLKSRSVPGLCGQNCG